MYKKVVVTGSLAFDHIMSMPGQFKNHILPDKLHILNVSFIMNTFRQEFGGTAGNIAYSLSLLNIPTTLVAATGDDFSAYKTHLSKFNKSLNLSGLNSFKGVKTAQGFVITDKDDNQIWGFFEGAMKYSDRLALKKYCDKDSILVIAPNDPVAMVKYVNQAIKLKVPYVFDPAFNISHFSIEDLKKGIENSTILIGNDYEVTLIERRLKITHKKLLEMCNLLITTLGAKGSSIETKNSLVKISNARPKNESDPTGAGDAFRAGFLAGYIQDLPLATCGKMGSLAAVYTVEKYGTQTHSYTHAQFAKRYKLNFKETLPIS